MRLAVFKLITGTLFLLSVGCTSELAPATSIKNDSANYVSFSTSSQTVWENAGAVSVTVGLIQALTSSVQIPYTVSGTATSPADHDLQSGFITFAAGETSKTLSLNIVNDAAAENNETIVITLSATDSVLVSSSATHTITIIDNDSLTYTNLVGLPAGVDPTSILNVSVGGYGVTSYFSKILTDGTTDCSSQTGYTEYSAAVPITQNLSSFTNGTMLTLCVLAGSKVTGGVGFPAWSSATSYSWVKDTLVSLSAAEKYTCGLANHGALACWGANSNGQLGIGTTINSSSPVKVNDSSIFASVSTKGGHSCGITSAGVLKCWGSNSYGELGDGTSTSRSSPVTINSGTTFSKVAAGDGHTCAITLVTHEVKCWGWGAYYQLGLGSTLSSSTPQWVDSGVTYSDISASTNFTCGITVAGELKCWGNNSYGVLGNMGTISSLTTPTVIDSGTLYKQISAGSTHVCGITSADVLKCWGTNGHGQLGSTICAPMTTPTVVDSGVAYKSIGASAGNGSTCGLTTAGVLKCWGYNLKANLGNNTYTDIETPTVIDSGILYQQVAVGQDHICGVTTTSLIKCWGTNEYGQLGDSAVAYLKTPTVIDSSVTYTQVSSGASQTCGISGSGLKCWGENTKGQLGDNSFSKQNSPTLVAGSANDYSKISTGGTHTCGISNTGQLRCWGNAANGRLGTGAASTDIGLPTAIDGGAVYSQVSTGQDHACAITTSGDVKCWGLNGYYQLANPYAELPTPSAITEGTPGTYSSISAGGSHTCAIRTDQKIKCWGNNSSGQLGDGTSVTPATSPNYLVSVDSAVNYLQVSAGGSHSCAVTTGGILKCWGLNDKGQIGDGTVTSRNSPTVIDSGTSYIQVSTGQYHTCAIAIGGALKCWGAGFGYGPVALDSSSSFSKVSAGSAHTCAITNSGVLKCWGNNSSSQLGNGYVPWMPHLLY